MTEIHDMPPDPFDDDGIDPFAVEAAEKLAREDVSAGDPRWDHIGGEPTIDDFTEAERELNTCSDIDHVDGEECATGPFTRMMPWLSAIAILVVVAMVLTYVLR